MVRFFLLFFKINLNFHLHFPSTFQVCIFARFLFAFLTHFPLCCLIYANFCNFKSAALLPPTLTMPVDADDPTLVGAALHDDDDVTAIWSVLHFSSTKNIVFTPFMQISGPPDPSTHRNTGIKSTVVKPSTFQVD